MGGGVGIAYKSVVVTVVATVVVTVVVTVLYRLDNIAREVLFKGIACAKILKGFLKNKNTERKFFGRFSAFFKNLRKKLNIKTQLSKVGGSSTFSFVQSI
jgi:hypothetical protein